jgi:predicted nuclease of predicted toxin-antitoxin system
MKVKIDENLPAEIAADLRDLGHDAMTVVDQGMAGIDHEQLMSHYSARLILNSRLLTSL